MGTEAIIVHDIVGPFYRGDLGVTFAFSKLFDAPIISFATYNTDNVISESPFAKKHFEVVSYCPENNPIESANTFKSFLEVTSKYSRFVVDRINELKPKIVVYTSPLGMFSSRLVSRSEKIGYIHNLPKEAYDHLFIYIERMNKVGKSFHGFYSESILNTLRDAFIQMDTLLFNSEFTKNRFLTRYPSLISKSHAVVYPPIIVTTTDNYYSGKSKRDHIHLVSFARHEQAKRVDVVLESVVTANEIYCLDVGLEVYSIGHLTEELIRKYGAYEYIRFMGQVSREKLINALVRADASVYVPYKEDFGISCAESLGIGTMCVSVTSGGLSEIWHDIYMRIFEKLQDFPIIWDEYSDSFNKSTQALRKQLPGKINQIPNLLEKWNQCITFAHDYIIEKFGFNTFKEKVLGVLSGKE